MATIAVFDSFRRLAGRMRARKDVNPKVFGQKLGLTTKLFGCWHDNLSRPFAHGKSSYRTCLQCGARRQFDPETFRTHGSFYGPPAVRQQ